MAGRELGADFGQARESLGRTIELLRLELDDAEVEYRLACDDYGAAHNALFVDEPSNKRPDTGAYLRFQEQLIPYHNTFHATMRRTSHLSITLNTLIAVLASYQPAAEETNSDEPA